MSTPVTFSEQQVRIILESLARGGACCSCGEAPVIPVPPVTGDSPEPGLRVDSPQIDEGTTEIVNTSGVRLGDAFAWVVGSGNTVQVSEIVDFDELNTLNQYLGATPGGYGHRALDVLPAGTTFATMLADFEDNQDPAGERYYASYVTTRTLNIVTSALEAKYVAAPTTHVEAVYRVKQPQGGSNTLGVLIRATVDDAEATNTVYDQWFLHEDFDSRAFRLELIDGAGSAVSKLQAVLAGFDATEKWRYERPVYAFVRYTNT
jgi:hypothetical protein